MLEQESYLFKTSHTQLLKNPCVTYTQMSIVVDICDKKKFPIK